MRLLRVFGFMYVAAICVAQDPLDVTSMDILPTSGSSNATESVYVTSVFSNIFPTSQPSTESQTIYEPPVPSLHLQSPWAEIFPFEKAEFLCLINDSSDWNVTWYKSGSEVQETDPNLSFSMSQGVVLTITAASPAHSGLYVCQGHHTVKGSTTYSNRLELKVDANKPKATLKQNPKWEHMYPGESVTFQCMIDKSQGWEYEWFRNDTKIQESNITYRIDSLTLSDTGRYHCKAKRGKSHFYTEQSETATLQVYEPPTPSLRLLTSWSDVFVNEKVALSCNMDSSNWTFIWHKHGMELQGDSVLKLSAGGSHLKITSASLAHQGEYSCQAQMKSRKVTSVFSNTAIIHVHGTLPKPSLSKDPIVNSMYVGENTTFTCLVDVATDWVYQWYKDGTTLFATDETLQIPHLGPHDAGTYQCKATRGLRTFTFISDKMTQDVLEIPVPSMVVSTQWADVFPTERVTLSCAIETSSDWTYKWQKDGQVIQSNMSFTLDGTTLSIDSASDFHGGTYSCSATLNSRPVSSNISSGVPIIVYGKKPKAILVQDPADTLLHTGDSVSYSCHINVSSGWEYRWYKDAAPLTVPGNNYTIHTLALRNTGSYKCQAIRGQSTAIFETEQSLTLSLQVEERPLANIIVLTGWSEVFSTDSLVLQCEVTGSRDTWNYTWFVKGQQITNSSSEKHTVTPQNDPEQSQYACQGIRTRRPYHSTKSDALATKNLLLKRRVLLSISGCIFFGIVAVFLGCFVLKVTRKPEDKEGRPEEPELFLTMAQLKDRVDAPCLLVDYITDAQLNNPAIESEDVICSETTQLSVISQQDPVTTESTDKTAEGSALVSFQH
ncbi:basement membrane-specific heparan sulfate proteoglycan core protein-like isoform X2 [Nerophis ophidion]|uniref:basement membrane-specific heparan sulfate proteoglycan core protein-like isoform X2 n=1 Tax=Nerophis ophidion TaxID=159077 RepID=UPI002ADFBFC7|nr:basement membrane-specific heparan sulfate proteoglycan core protein-like isoform X2 [Nerophis ophidion]